MIQCENNFTLDYYTHILRDAHTLNYSFMTLQQYWDNGCPKDKVFVIRHDLDTKPLSLCNVLEIEHEFGIASTIFVRVSGNTYNPFDYITYPIIKNAQFHGYEIGLHTNFVEFAQCNDVDPFDVLEAELNSIRSFYGDVKSIACHRDVNYTYNSLPFVEQHWQHISTQHKLSYQAYDARIMNSLLFVNETAEQKLGWRSLSPEDAVVTGKSICLSTHPHWWFKKHPFEL